MSALPSRAALIDAPLPGRRPPARVALLGTGNVGRAVLARLASWRGTPLAARVHLVHAAGARRAVTAAGGLAADEVAAALAPTDEPGALAAMTAALAGPGPRVIVDATASDDVAARHAGWLADGVHVVTACKLGQGGSLARWRAIQDARARGRSRYGDAATVGAGLPLLATIRALVAGGDRIHRLEGVLSGSLAWLCHHHDGRQPFSALVGEARALGFTEPDPRDDLSGEDVRRKLLVLARAAGAPLEPADVEVGSLVPPALAAAPLAGLDGALPLLDAPLAKRLAAARAAGGRLRFVARLDALARGRASVGLAALPADHPLAAGAGTDNTVAIWSDRYRARPLVITGPGAGADLTAAALLDDVLAIAHAA